MQQWKASFSDEDVQFYWLIVTADFEDHMIHEILLNKIVARTIPHHTGLFASKWMARKVASYKQCTKKPTQRTKSLQRELHDATYVAITTKISYYF